MDQPIIYPKIWKRRGTGRQAQLGGELGLQENNTAYPAYSFVKLSSGKLAAIATGEATAAGGFDVYAGLGSNGDIPIAPPYQTRARHFPFELRDTQFLMNITDGSGHVGQANSAPTLSNVSIGTSYGCYVPTSGTYKGICMLNQADTTNLLFRIVDIPLRPYPGPLLVLASTYNGLVVVEFLTAVIQQIG